MPDPDDAVAVTPEHLDRLLEAIVSVGSELDLPAMLRRIIEAATALVDARYGALGVLDGDGERLAEFITVGIPEAVADRIGNLPEGHGILGLLIVEPQPLRLENLREHPESYGWPEGHPSMTTFLGVPIRVRDTVFGNLYLCDKRGGGPFTELDERLIVGLAATAGVAVEHARLHEQVSRLGVLEDRERIARDLHDTVIQRIFATGLALQSVALRVGDADLADRLGRCVDDLDETVRHIRTTIFELESARLPGRSLRQEVLELVAEAAEHLGFDPVVVFDGPLDLAVPDDVADHLLAVAREALANVVRHAATRHLEVDLRVARGELSLAVRDEGVGLPGALRPEGRGVANLRSRAEQLGGAFTLAARPTGGTELTWTVPVER
jgi:signal transduction histidine kinase